MAPDAMIKISTLRRTARNLGSWTKSLKARHQTQLLSLAVAHTRRAMFPLPREIDHPLIIRLC